MTASDFGVQLRRVESSRPGDAPSYFHQDDHYVIILLNDGSGRIAIDFEEHLFSQGDLILIYPRQIPRVISAEDATGWLLFVDGSLMGKEEKCLFDKLLLFTPSIRLDEKRKEELNRIASILMDKLHHINDNQTKTTAKRLTETFVSIVAESIIAADLQHEGGNPRHIEMALRFCNLVKSNVAASRSPSHYARELNVSPVYLNEIIKTTLGTSASAYIKNELMLQAKRLLIHTNLTIKEISCRLGMEDHAYFSRLFSRMTGVSPSLFRQRNLK